MERAHDAKTGKNAGNSRTNIEHINTYSSTSRNQMERVRTHQEKRLLTILQLQSRYNRTPRHRFLSQERNREKYTRF